MEKAKKDIKEIIEKPRAKRQIIIETDGTNIEIIKAEVAGNLEFYGILSQLLKRITITK